MLARFYWGFTRPLVLLLRLRAEPVAWRAFVRTVSIQAALTLCLGSAFTVANWYQHSEEKQQATLADALAELEDARQELLAADAGVEVDELASLKDEVDAQAAKVETLERKAGLRGGLHWWERLALWASNLVGAQLLVLALSRDFQDRLAQDLSLVAGLQPEDAPTRIRIRVDLPWLWRKLRRRARGLWVTTAGVVALSPLIPLGYILGYGNELSSALVTLVSAYWWVVFTAAKSARAWRFEGDSTPPTPVKVLGELAEQPWLKWLGPKWVARFSRWATRSVAAPARAIEEDLGAFAGLAVARAVASIPVLRIGLRAAVIVAAGEALESSLPLQPVVEPVGSSEAGSPVGSGAVSVHE